MKGATVRKLGVANMMELGGATVDDVRGVTPVRTAKERGKDPGATAVRTVMGPEVAVSVMKEVTATWLKERELDTDKGMKSAVSVGMAVMAGGTGIMTGNSRTGQVWDGV